MTNRFCQCLFSYKVFSEIQNGCLQKTYLRKARLKENVYLGFYSFITLSHFGSKEET